MEQTTIPCIAEVWRGEVVESRHYGIVAVVDGSGKLVASAGDVETVTFLRSSAKPFQALPLLLTGAADRFSFTEAELAIACASHNGEPVHTATVEGILAKIKLPATALLCGIHEPFSKDIADQQKRAHQEPTALHNNCSGKHAGMLAVARHLGEPIENYISVDHPLQKLIRTTVAEFSNLPEHTVQQALDGCGVPTFALPIRRMASMFARFSFPEPLAGNTRDACKRITHAMTTHAHLVAGENEFDTELMRAARGHIISKGGAEGLWCAGVQPSSTWPTGLGIALKILDGSPRSRACVALGILQQLRVVDDELTTRISPVTHSEITNRRGIVVGRIQSTLHLLFH